jgi:DNA mismatch repair protein MutS2
MGEDEVEVQVGVMRVRTRPSDLELAAAKASAQSETAHPTRSASTSPARSAELLPASPGMELDLRGQRAEDAVEALERYLDGAYLAGLPFVRIIHGKGTGRLREVVRQSLGQNPHVRSYEAGGEKEGGEGVTVARLKTG